jgi:hypothetical protein
MTGHRGWHLDDDLLGRYVGGTVDAAGGSSVEQHVLHCDGCRARVNRLVRAQPEGFPLDDVWARLEEEVQAPRPSRGERLLSRLGLPPDEALLLWAAPAFRTPWLAATVTTLAFATLAATVSDHRGVLLFLVVAPLLPVVGVALAYGQDADPAFEVSAATPYPALRLVLLRTVAVLATTVPLTVLAGLLLPNRDAMALAWLAPALAAVATTMALSTWLTVARAATVVGCLWAALVATLAGPGFATPTHAVAAAGLPGYALLALVSLAVFRLRGAHLTHLGGHA